MEFNQQIRKLFKIDDSIILSKKYMKRDTWAGVLVVMICIWYSCAVITITTTKEMMLQFQFPYLLCTSQFLFASVLSYAYLFCYSRVKQLQLPESRVMVYYISATYTLGFVFTNIAFSLGNIT